MSKYMDLVHMLVRAGYQPSGTQHYVHDDVDENGHRWNGNHPIYGQCALWQCIYNPALPDCVVHMQTCNGHERDYSASGTFFTGKSTTMRFGHIARGTEEHHFNSTDTLRTRFEELGIPEWRDVYFKPKQPRRRKAVV